MRSWPWVEKKRRMWDLAWRLKATVVGVLSLEPDMIIRRWACYSSKFLSRINLTRYLILSHSGTRLQIAYGISLYSFSPASHANNASLFQPLELLPASFRYSTLPASLSRNKATCTRPTRRLSGNKIVRAGRQKVDFARARTGDLLGVNEMP